MPLRVNGYAVKAIRYNGAVITAQPQRLSSCDIDINTGSIDYTLEGDSTVYGLNFTISGNDIVYTWPDGFTCTITVTGSLGGGT